MIQRYTSALTAGPRLLSLGFERQDAPPIEVPRAQPSAQLHSLGAPHTAALGSSPRKAELFVPTLSLPPAEREFLREQYSRHDIILEYGSGGSTLIAAAQPHALIMSVESDKTWCENMSLVLRRDFPKANVRMHWADTGPTGNWGWPTDPASWPKFSGYPLSVWDQSWFRQPDLILIDGRFRVGCLLTALLRSSRPTTVLIDDYANRPHYIKAIERFVKPVQLVGRMARFQISPMPFPPERMSEIFTLLTKPD